MIKGLLSLAVVGLGVAMIFEREYGISRSARLADLPDMACVRRVLDGIEAIKEVKEDHVEEDVSAGQKSFHRYWYTGEKVDGQLVFSTFVNGEVKYHNYHILINRRPSGDLIQATRRVMVRMEQVLAAECGVRELADGVEEVCKRVDCGD